MRRSLLSRWLTIPALLAAQLTLGAALPASAGGRDAAPVGMATVTEPWHVTGRVTDEVSGLPVAGLELHLLHDSGAWDWTYTDADGVYLFSGGPSEGTAQLVALPGDSYATEWWDGHIRTLDENGDFLGGGDQLAISSGTTTVADMSLYPDGLGPVITEVGPDRFPWQRSYPTISLSAEDAGCGVGVLRCRIDGGAPFDYSGPVTLAQEGYHTLRYWALDRVGNISWPGMAVDSTYRIDTQDPVTTFVGSTAYYNTTSADVSLAPYDAVSGVRSTYYRLDGAAHTPGTSIHLSEGTHTLTFWSWDNAGNNETYRRVTILVSSSGPPAPAPVVTLPSITGHTLSTPVTPSTVTYGRSFTVSSFLRPRHKAGLYSLKYEGYRYERQSNGSYKWVRRATWYGKNYNYSTYTKAIKTGAVIKLRGKWRVRAVHTHTGYLPKYSAWRYFYVR